MLATLPKLIYMELHFLDECNTGMSLHKMCMRIVHTSMGFYAVYCWGKNSSSDWDKQFIIIIIIWLDDKSTF